MVTVHWLGKPEKTAIVTVTDHKQVIDNTVQILKRELAQDAIAVLQTNNMVFA